MPIYGILPSAKFWASPSRPPEPPGRKDSKWEILTNLEAGQNYSILPKKIEGLLTKKRKWPMKGTFFFLNVYDLVLFLDANFE